MCLFAVIHHLHIYALYDTNDHESEERLIGKEVFFNRCTLYQYILDPSHIRAILYMYRCICTYVAATVKLYLQPCSVCIPL